VRGNPFARGVVVLHVGSAFNNRDAEGFIEWPETIMADTTLAELQIKMMRLLNEFSGYAAISTARKLNEAMRQYQEEVLGRASIPKI